jgi:DNA-binding FadR family transcriptional regulator
MRKIERAAGSAAAVEGRSRSAAAYAVPNETGRRSAQWVADRLREAITEGVYPGGRRLPAERQLAEVLSASRGTVREALRLLQEDRMVERRVGIGTFVLRASGDSEEDVVEITSPLELMDVREALEPQIVRLVVRNAAPRDIAVLAEAIGQLERCGGDRHSFSEWDQRFHQAMADATHNPLMIHIYHSINRARGHSQWQAIKDKVLTPERIAAYNREHRALFEAVVARDINAALKVVAGHLHSARDDLMTR